MADNGSTVEYPQHPDELRAFIEEKSGGDPVERAKLQTLAAILGPYERNKLTLALSEAEASDFTAIANRIAQAEATRVKELIEGGFVHWLDDNFIALARAHPDKPKWKNILAGGTQAIRSTIAIEQGKINAVLEKESERYPTQEAYLNARFDSINGNIMSQIIAGADDELAGVVLHRLGIITPEETIAQFRSAMKESMGQRSLSSKEKERHTVFGADVDMQIYNRSDGSWDFYAWVYGNQARNIITTPLPQNPFPQQGNLPPSLI